MTRMVQQKSLSFLFRMKKLNPFWGISVLFLFISSCVYDSAVIPTDCTNIHWTYHMTSSGQDHWVDLCTGYSACSGMSQSPVNISGAMTKHTLSKLIFSYSTTPAEIENNGHTIEFVCEPGNKLTIGGTQYELLQFHYHAQSEHQVDGNNYPLEVHFVHKASDSDYAVVGIFFAEGTSNSLFTEYLSHFPHEEGTYADPSEIELEELLPVNKSYFHYSGSLTTPPCSEVVHWYVLKNTITASASQINQLQALLKNNSRQIQGLNGRKIYSFDE